MLNKNVLLAFVLTLTSVPALFAAPQRIASGSAPAAENQNPPLLQGVRAPRWAESFAVEGFYGSGQKKLLSVDIDKLDIAGLSAIYTASGRDSFFANYDVHPEFFGILSFGGGSLDQTWIYDSSCEELDYELFTMQLAGGFNLRGSISDRVSVFGGARIGLAYERLKAEYNYTRYSTRVRYQATENDIGIIYGAGGGAEFLLSEKFALLVGVDYIVSTMRPEFDVYGEKFKTKAQAYLTFSFGVRYIF
ncbi:MAG: hypothetical protein ACI4QA_03355 [Candidatus Spyradosoma sp.]